MTDQTAFIPRKSPAQRRSRETVETILEAAARVLEAVGPAGFNTNAVAARAGVSVGSLYQYFPSKNALVAELSRRGAEAMLAALEGAVAEDGVRTLEQDLRRIVRAAIGWQTARPQLERALDQMEERVGFDIAAHGVGLRVQALIARLLTAHLPGAAADQLSEAAADSLSLARTLIDRAVERGPIEARALEDRLVGMLIGYLGALPRA